MKVTLRGLILFVVAGFISLCLTQPLYAASETQESIQQKAAAYGTSAAYIDGLVTNFDSMVDLNTKGDATITENIIVYFPYQRHGIYRWIPNEVIVNGSPLRQPISIISVSYQKLPNAQNPQTGTQTFTKYTSSMTSGHYTLLKIGDADTLITGAYRYTIKYRMSRAIRIQSDYQELYLNITGDQWELPILSASAIVTGNINIAQDYKCYTGSTGSTASNCTIDKVVDTLRFETTTAPSVAAEGLTIAIKYPAKTFTGPSALDIFVEQVLPFFSFILPIIALIYGYFAWRRYGKDTPVSAIPPQFVPTKEMEIESMSVMDSLLAMRAKSVSMLAELIRVAQKGYLTISYEKDKIKLLLDEKQQQGLPVYLESQPVYIQKLIKTLTKNFQAETSLNSLKNVYDDLSEVNRLARDEFKNSPYISKDSEKVQTRFIVLTVLGFVTGIGIMILFSATVFESLWFLLPLSFILCGIIFLIFTIGMLKRTKEGDSMYLDLLGLKKYIQTAEVKRLEFFNNPKKMITHFEQILPYSIILGLDKQWTREFGPVLEQLQYQPTWMVSDVPFYNAWPRTYAAMSTTMAATSVKLATPPQSSSSSFGGGGGFSGGGSGGGGGGSW